MFYHFCQLPELIIFLHQVLYRITSIIFLFNFHNDICIKIETCIYDNEQCIIVLSFFFKIYIYIHISFIINKFTLHFYIWYYYIILNKFALHFLRVYIHVSQVIVIDQYNEIPVSTGNKFQGFPWIHETAVSSKCQVIVTQLHHIARVPLMFSFGTVVQ